MKNKNTNVECAENIRELNQLANADEAYEALSLAVKNKTPDVEEKQKAYLSLIGDYMEKHFQPAVELQQKMRSKHLAENVFSGLNRKERRSRKSS